MEVGPAATILVTGDGYPQAMDTVIGIAVVIIMILALIGWLDHLGGRGADTDFDTKDPGEDY